MSGNAARWRNRTPGLIDEKLTPVTPEDIPGLCLWAAARNISGLSDRDLSSSWPNSTSSFSLAATSS
jgi:hypothetical protein